MMLQKLLREHDLQTLSLGRTLNYTLYENEVRYDVTILESNAQQNLFFMDEKIVICNYNLFWHFLGCNTITKWKECFDACKRITTTQSNFLQ